jgi:hypothetical protein
MDGSKFLENLIKAYIERQNVYALQILSGAKTFDEYKNMCGKYYALREAEDIAKKVYRETFEHKVKIEKESGEYGSFQE